MSLEKYIENIITWASTKGIKLIIGILMLYIGGKIVNKLVKIMNIEKIKHAFLILIQIL